MALNNKHLFFTVLEAGKIKIKALADLVSNESPVPGSWTATFLLCPHVTEGMRGLSGNFFIRALIPFRRTSHSWPNHLPNFSPPHIIAMGVRISTYELGWGHTNVHTTTDDKSEWWQGDQKTRKLASHRGYGCVEHLVPASYQFQKSAHYASRMCRWLHNGHNSEDRRQYISQDHHGPWSLPPPSNR